MLRLLVVAQSLAMQGLALPARRAWDVCAKGETGIVRGPPDWSAGGEYPIDGPQMVPTGLL